MTNFLLLVKPYGKFVDNTNNYLTMSMDDSMYLMIKG